MIIIVEIHTIIHKIFLRIRIIPQNYKYAMEHFEHNRMQLQMDMDIVTILDIIQMEVHSQIIQELLILVIATRHFAGRFKVVTM
jgi:hypothetical protein